MSSPATTLNLAAALDHHVRLRPGREAVVMGERRLSVADGERESEKGPYVDEGPPIRPIVSPGFQKTRTLALAHASRVGA